MRTLLFLVLALLASLGQAEVISGRVVHDADVDIITVLDADKVQHKIRLAGIDTPERSQAYGQHSRDSLAKLVANRTVIVETHKKDRYGRNVGKVLGNGRGMNIEQIQRGMAWLYREYARELTPADQQSYDRAETEAKNFRKGLWIDNRPTPPWEFRLRNRDR